MLPCSDLFTIVKKKPQTIILYAIIAFLILSSFCRADSQGAWPDTAGQPAMKLSAEVIVNGSLLVLEVDTAQIPGPVTDVHVTYGQRVIPAFDHPSKGSSYFALIAVPMDASAGRAEITVHWLAGNKRHSRPLPIRIEPGTYRTEKLSVEPGKVDLSNADLARVKREKAEIRQIYATGNPLMLWKSLFQFPLESEITSPFGNRRMFNGQLRSYHNGVDFRAHLGTPVSVANSGIVRLAKNLFFSGNLVIVDHGTGIFTNYAHLSKIGVSPGQRLQKGAPIGLSGATGRVSGPHLHWGIKVNDTYVDPFRFVDAIALLVEN